MILFLLFTKIAILFLNYCYSLSINNTKKKQYIFPEQSYIYKTILRKRNMHSLKNNLRLSMSVLLPMLTFLFIIYCRNPDGYLIDTNVTSNSLNIDFCTQLDFNLIKSSIIINTKRYSSRHFTLLLLILSGDIESNPGPFSCPGCNRTVAKNHRAVNCDICLKWYHIKCEEISPKQYKNFMRKSDIDQFFFTCSACHLESLPFPDGYFQLFSDNDILFQDNHSDFLDNFNYNFKGLSTKKGLSISLLNINGLRSKLDNIKIMLNASNIDILCVNETKIDQNISNSDLSIYGYKFHRRDRNRHGGGVGIYYKEFLNVSSMPHLSSEGIESSWIKISFKKSSPIYICCAYRPPHRGQDKEKVENLISHFKSSISKLPSNSEIFILGDMNCDYSNNKNVLSSVIKNFCTSYHFQQLITEKTRVTETSSTLLDLVLTNSRHISFSGVDDVGISDHCLVFTERKLKKDKFGARTITTRSYKNFSSTDFLADLEKCDWSSVIDNNDLDSACENFNQTLLSVVDKHAPLKTHRVRNNQEAWINDDFLIEIKKRDYLKKTASLTKDPNDWAAFRKKRNHCNRLKKYLKSQHFSKVLHDNKNDGKKLWKHIRNLLPKDSSEKISSLKGDQNEILTENKDMANRFNTFFSTVGSKLASKFTSVRSDQINIPINENLFSFNLVSPETVSKIISNLDNNKAVGMDGVSVKILKSGSPLLSQILSFLFNKSLIIGKVPQIWKTKRVSPLFKDGDPNVCNNYRPISILPVIMKVFEKIVNHQICQFIENNNLITNFQSGFRKKHSTDTAVLEVTDFILNELDKGRHVGAVLIDFKKAFDTIDHLILLKKLFCLGFRDTSFDWIQSYLSDRKQFCKVGDSLSDPTFEECYGVPQGSVLGPLFFLIFINDLQGVISSYYHLYADDTIIIESSDNTNSLKMSLEDQLNRIDQWLTKNKLTINTSKTKSIFFGSKARLNTYYSENLTISYGETPLETVTLAKYLGVIFDDKLSWKEHVASIKSKAYHKLYKLKYISDFLTPFAKQLLIKSLVFPYLNYCSSSWNHLNVSTKYSLQKLFNKSLNFMNSPQKSIDEMWNVNLSITTFKAIHGLAPPYLCEKVKLTSNVHKHFTRSAKQNTLQTRRRGSKFSQKAFSYRAPIMWNNLPVNLRKLKSLVQFKSSVKEHFNTS